jgi:hypothetical protein
MAATLGELARYKDMSIRKKPAATQKKIPVEPVGFCKVDETHGPIDSVRKDKLCKNCGVFADKAKKRKSA